MTSPKPFTGFPAKMRYTPMPNIFLTTIAPQITNPGELKVTLNIFWRLYQKRGYPKFVTRRELLADGELMRGISEPLEPPERTLGRCLDLAVARGTLLVLNLERDGKREQLYLLSTEADRRAAEAVAKGELLAEYTIAEEEVAAEIVDSPNIFALYEQNIGILTPLIAEELKEAEKLYPTSWIQEAFKEAVNLNRRSWRYIARILERWAREGKGSGETGGYSKEAAKYFQGRYGHTIRR